MFVKEEIEKLLNARQKVIIAIDGNCAAGKTTLAEKIKDEFGGTVIALDSFFLPPELRTPERLACIGGNFHIERFRAEVIANLAEPRFTYGVFNCGVGEITEQITVNESRLLIIEGSYSLHPNLGRYYDYSVFVTTDYSTQLERIAHRNGERALENFISKWIPLENSYFNHYNIQSGCDFVLRT